VLLGYARISKGDDQTSALQRRALAEAGVERVFDEAASGGRWDRPALHRLLDQLRPGDVVVVWKLDRLSRSLKDLLAILERVDAAGAGFRSLTEAIDTTVPAGRMLMQLLGAFAEFERAMVRERTSAGLAAARAAGRIGGRRSKLTPAQRADVVENVTSGRRSAAAMARLYGVSAPTVSRLVAAHRHQQSGGAHALAE
jgi:DNA invertase Pin-like site-specific DNA recombinase